MQLLLFLGLIIISLYIFVTRPLALGILIMLSSLLLTTILGMTVNSWWGLILFLIYVGALLVLFVYVMAMSPNCFFSRPEKTTTASMVLMSAMTLIFSGLLILAKSELSLIDTKFSVQESPFLLDSFYNISCLVSLSLVLLMVMVAVVQLIPGKNQGAPLRPFE